MACPSSRRRSEAEEVELALSDPDQVAGRLRQQALPAERLPQLRDVDLERLLGRLGRLVLPERVGQALGGDGLVRVQEKHREERTVLRARQGHDSFPVDHVERAEDPELHLLARLYHPRFGPFGLRSGAALPGPNRALGGRP